jgi:hypothetical protein
VCVGAYAALWVGRAYASRVSSVRQCILIIDISAIHTQRSRERDGQCVSMMLHCLGRPLSATDTHTHTHIHTHINTYRQTYTYRQTDMQKNSTVDDVLSQVACSALRMLTRTSGATGFVISFKYSSYPMLGTIVISPV